MTGKKHFVASGIGIVILFLPQLFFMLRFDGRIHRQLDQVPVAEYGIVFGAYVTADGVLTDAARERVDAAVMLYREKKIEKLFISGDESSNEQASVMAAYAVARGVSQDAIVIDPLGIDTQDTCRHMARLAQGGTLLTQGYHLPRTMALCQREGIETHGLAVNHLNLLANRGNGLWIIVLTRVARFVRESALSWAVVLGVYERISNQAERLESSLTTWIRVSTSLTPDC